MMHVVKLGELKMVVLIFTLQIFISLMVINMTHHTSDILNLNAGIWRPQKYEGTYQDNAYHLDFSDPTS